MTLFEKAIAIALNAHAGQRDRNGDPYILHPLRIMAQMNDENSRIAAMLHDVVEDSPITVEDLRLEGFPEAIIATVAAITRRPREPYEDYIRRIKQTPEAIPIKLADLEDNLAIRRNRPLTDEDQSRIRRYLEAWKILTGQSRIP